MFLHLEHNAQMRAIGEMLIFHSERNADTKLSVSAVENMIASDATGETFKDMVMVELSHAPHALIAPNGDTLFI